MMSVSDLTLEDFNDISMDLEEEQGYDHEEGPLFAACEPFTARMMSLVCRNRDRTQCVDFSHSRMWQVNAHGWSPSLSTLVSEADEDEDVDSDTQPSVSFPASSSVPSPSNIKLTDEEKLLLAQEKRGFLMLRALKIESRSAHCCSCKAIGGLTCVRTSRRSLLIVMTVVASIILPKAFIPLSLLSLLSLVIIIKWI